MLARFRGSERPCFPQTGENHGGEPTTGVSPCARDRSEQSSHEAVPASIMALQFLAH